MTFTPQTQVWLLDNVPLSPNYEHQMDFANVASQTAYFEGKVSHKFTNFVYQREEVAVRVPVGYDDLYNCNYLMYNNANYSSKWFYAFVTRKEYVNPNMTKIYFQVDVWQTWQFDVTFLPSFIEREHCQLWNTDGTPVINTVPENLEYGTQYTVTGQQEYYATEYYYLLTCTTDLVGVLGASTIPANPPLPVPSKVGGLMTGLSYYIFTDLASIRAVYNHFNSSSNTQWLDCFQSWTLLPGDAVDTTKLNLNNQTVDGTAISYYSFQDYNSGALVGVDYKVTNKYSNLPSVTESKLLMYPYSFAEITTYTGESMEIQLEHINNTELNVIPWAAMNNEARVAYVVQDYNSDNTLDSAIILTNFPELPTVSSAYQEYLSRTKSQRAVGFVSDVVGGVLGVAGAVTDKKATDTSAIGAFVEFQNVANEIAKVQDAKRQPNTVLTQQGGNNFNASIGKLGFALKWKMITQEYRTILENFWSVYGYKVHQVKAPNLKTRQSWNFVKTIGAKLTGDVPQDQLDEIMQMFNNGVTLWHTTSVGDYTQANGVV